MKEEQKQNAGAAITGCPGERTIPQRPAPAAAQATGESRRLPYEAPAVEVIEVQTERGYAGSADDFGNGGRW